MTVIAILLVLGVVAAAIGFWARTQMKKHLKTAEMHAAAAERAWLDERELH